MGLVHLSAEHLGAVQLGPFKKIRNFDIYESTASFGQDFSGIGPIKTLFKILKGT